MLIVEQFFTKKNANNPYPIASVTKIATVLYALEIASDRLSEVVVAKGDALASLSYQKKQKARYQVPAYWLEPDGTHIGIKNGEKFTLRQLLEALIIVSANDAGNVIAMYLGEGSIPRFMKGMNTFIKSLGCHKTQFYNPHGLHFPNHVSTAYDLAHLMRNKGLKNKTFCNLMKQSRYIRPKTNMQDSITLMATNKLMIKGHKYYYPKALGGKTGYTSLAQRNLIAVAKEGDRTLIVVLLKCKERGVIFEEAKRLFEAAFNEKKMQRILVKAGPQRYSLQLDGATIPITTYCRENICEQYYPSEEVPVKGFVQWYKLSLPILKGQCVGHLHILTAKEDYLLYKIPLYATHEVQATWSHWVKSLIP